MDFWEKYETIRLLRKTEEYKRKLEREREIAKTVGIAVLSFMVVLLMMLIAVLLIEGGVLV